MYKLAEADFNFPDGDIDIEIRGGKNTITGRVSSAAMALASPVWKKFVFPPWEVPQSTATPNGNYVLIIVPTS
jgi:hypothetical protein